MILYIRYTRGIQENVGLCILALRRQIYHLDCFKVSLLYVKSELL